MESELFWLRASAFTGAVHLEARQVQLARAGRCFWTEISEIPVEMQFKLLRVLQGASSNGGGIKTIRAT